MSATLTDIYDLPQEHKDFRDTIRQIVDEKVRPRAAEIDATGEYPWDVRKLFGEQDILALPFDEQYGGTGTGTVMLQLAVEEIAKACASSALILMVQELGTLPIAGSACCRSARRASGRPPSPSPSPRRGRTRPR